METIVATAFWRRLDTEGHDACRLIRKTDGWRLSGNAAFDHQGELALLAYRVDFDVSWKTLAAHVDGSVGLRPLAFDIETTASGEWLLNGEPQPEAEGCIDLDLGFTPATNLIAIRRLQPAEGVEIQTDAAYYLEFTDRLGCLGQTYRRIGRERMHYTSPAHGYEATLTVSGMGFVTEYPGLWSGRVVTA